MPNTQLLEPILHGVRSLQLSATIDSALRDTNHKELMSSVTDVLNSQDAILALVSEASINLSTMILDANTSIASLKNQQAPVSLAQLNNLSNKNNAILAALQSLNTAIKSEDAVINPPVAVVDEPTTPSTQAVVETPVTVLDGTDSTDNLDTAVYQTGEVSDEGAAETQAS